MECVSARKEITIYKIVLLYFNVITNMTQNNHICYFWRDLLSFLCFSVFKYLKSPKAKIAGWNFTICIIYRKEGEIFEFVVLETAGRDFGKSEALFLQRNPSQSRGCCATLGVPGTSHWGRQDTGLDEPTQFQHSSSLTTSVCSWNPGKFSSLTAKPLTTERGS